METQGKIKKLNILVAEDNHINRTVILALMSQNPSNITFAVNGLEALQMATHNTYALILMDLCMPIMDGMEATREIRKLERLKGQDRTPIIGVSAHVGGAERREAMTAGMNDYLTKPIKIRSLLDMLERWSTPVKDQSSKEIIAHNLDKKNRQSLRTLAAK